MKNDNEAWSKILNLKKIISDKETSEINNTVANLRKEYGFRKIK